MNKRKQWIILATIFVAANASAQIYNGPIKLGSPLISYQAITQGFGVDWSRNPEQVHTGIDLATPRGNKVFSAKAGVVYKTGNWGGVDGGYIVVFNKDGTSNGYLHVNVLVKEGQKLEQGQEIGTIYKDHLHFNQCRQADGCQHGAFPNPTYPTGKKNDLTKYYVRPKLR